jgi:parallel beta helix pectate lyase-like protein/disaggregatase-related protein
MERNNMLAMALAGLLGLAVWAVPCDARLVTVAITAEVIEVQDETGLLKGEVQVGDAINGTYSYDTSAPNVSHARYGGRYEFSSAPCGIVLEIGDGTFQTDPNDVRFVVVTEDDEPGIACTYDRFSLESLGNTALDDGISVDTISICLEDSYCEGDPVRPLLGLTGSHLPVRAPELTDWPVRDIGISGTAGATQADTRSTGYMIRGRLVSTALVPIPTRPIYVDDDARGREDGTSWTSAYRFLQDALTEARLATDPVEIRVAQGTYRPDQGLGFTPGNQGASFQLVDGVALKGGCAGLGSPDPDARDIEYHRTVLSGDLEANDPPGDRVLPYPPDPTALDNSRCVVRGAYLTEATILDGFVITGGYQWGAIRPRGPVGGAGMHLQAASPVIINCRFVGNHYWVGHGGALFCWDQSYPTLRHCIFVRNSARRGGAVSSRDRSIPKITNCTFYANYADEGGAIYDVCKVTNCILWGNVPGELDFSENAPYATYSAVQGHWPGQGNIDADPCFAAPGYWADPNDLAAEVDPNDSSAVWIAGDYHLKSQAGHWDAASQSWVLDDVTSPCIDAGDPVSLIDDESAPNGARINMGAYGGTAEASKSVHQE